MAACSVISGKALQEQVEELALACPVLLPSMTPKGYQDEDLLRLALVQGPSERQQLEQLLCEAGSSCQSCCMCAAPGRAAAPCEPGQDEEASTLRFTTFTRVNFLDKTVQITQGGFACGLCRAAVDTWRMLRFGAVKVSSDKPDRCSLLQQVCLHLAAVNRASEDILGSSDLAVAWAQELYNRAYGLHVVASNIVGWKVASSAGPVPRACSATKLAGLLLGEGQQTRKRKKEVESCVAEPRKQLKRVKQPEATEEAPATHAKKGFGKGQQAATVSTKGKAKPQGLNGTKQANVTGVGAKTAAAVAKAGRHQKKQIVL